jgi:hypothetical protein
MLATTSPATNAMPALPAWLQRRGPRVLVGFQVLCAWYRACLHAR